MRLGTIACTLLATLAMGVGTLSAQSVRGVGDDATTAPRGVIRVQFSTSITDFTQRYGKGTPGRTDGTFEPLGIDFSVDTLGAAQFPGLSAVQGALRTLTGNSAFTLSLGRVSVAEQVRVQTTPIQLEAGLTRWLSIGVMVPIVSARNQVGVNINSGVAVGNVGFNPGRLADTAVTSNALLVTQLTAAQTQLATLLTNCNSNPGSNAQCPAIIANAPAINASASAFTSGLTQVYGTSRATGSPFVPAVGSAADSAIRNRVTTFRTQYTQYGVTAIAATTVGPSSAVAVITPDGLRRIVTDSSLGLLAAPLGTVTHQGLGDIEVAVKLRLLDSFGMRTDSMRFLPKGLNVRQSIAGVYRLATGTIDLPGNYLDYGTGQGNTAIEMRSFTDLVYGRHFFASVIARYTLELPDQQVRRITDSPDQGFAAAWRERLVDRNIGDQLQIEVTPRWVLNEFFSVGAQYLFRRKAEDAFTGTYTVSSAESGLPGAVTLDANTLRLETDATEQRVGLGLTFSTVAAHARRKAAFPIEVQFFLSRTLAGTGGAVPRLSIQQLQVRLYPRL
ncbi:MAG: hypothetical protein H7099_02740 [Gemmatimonadaceae bacterium]|nr:hypothetical protein [Gemmatimonadaceae bacterium]